MAITVPGELDFVLDMLGYEWPNVDEDAVREAAALVRELRDDLQRTLDAMDARIAGELSAGFQSRAALAYLEAWTENRTQNMDALLGALPGVADGIELIADAVVALKTKVVAELAITAAQLAAAAATAVATAGVSVAANAAIIVARKKALDVVTELAVAEVVAQALGAVVEPLAGTIADLADAIVDAPLVSGGADVPAVDVDFAVMDAIADAMDECGAEQRAIGIAFASRVSALPIFAS
ncbi:WXG100 family type VII secretion target [Microbacterium album]|uniref:Outer membrane channel protein CpnT-like N-terminal domain-containing protein n=1 Tax=Microbacterium album TaxID=2053191 RepID=A0A917IFA1_9MICO|nr:hypothetical protein [Microbacterium album]GGH47773.1 hypothetical protein GCM10010921_24760 [Microbacterium album]